MPNPLTVQTVARAELTAYEKNARTHSAEQVAQIAASIREFGWTSPILVDEAGVIIAGHGRLAAAALLELAEVPVIRLAGLTEARKRALRLADNQLPLNAGWDLELLAAEVAASIAEGGPVEVLGFSQDYLDALVADNSKALAEAQEHQRLALMPPAKAREGGGATGKEPPAGAYREQFGVIVLCADEKEQERIYDELRGRGLNCRVVTT